MMRFKAVAFLLGVLSVWAVVRVDILSQKLATIEPTSHNEVISRTEYDIDHDGVDETIEVVLVEGCRYHDAILWAGMGEKWEGSFHIRVRRGRTLLHRQSLNELMFTSPQGSHSLFFWTPEFPLVLEDYNDDGQIDFNLGQYGASNWNDYQLFTIKPNGKIARLPGGKHLVSAGHANSTDKILLADGQVGFSYYSQESGNYLTAWYLWDGEQFVFVNHEPTG